METKDYISIISACISFIALATSMYAARGTRRLATSGFQSAQRVKHDTAVFVAALRSLMVKSVLYTQQNPSTRDTKGAPGSIDIQPEKTTIQAFMTSSTAIAYHQFLIGMSRRAKIVGKDGEEWRLFFIYVTQLLSESNPYAAGRMAARIELLFDRVSEGDLETMSADLENLTGSIKSMIQNRKHDALFAALLGLAEDRREDEQRFEPFIKFLRDEGVDDPEVDLFWSAASGDTKTLEKALARGANINVTSSEIIERYKEQWQRFSESMPE